MRLHAVSKRGADGTVQQLTNDGRLATLAETVGLLATATRDDGDLRAPLLALTVQAQIWLDDLDDDPRPAA